MSEPPRSTVGTTRRSTMRVEKMSCELCGKKLSPGKCVFSTYERVIQGKKHRFCCVRCAETFEKKSRKR